MPKVPEQAPDNPPPPSDTQQTPTGPPPPKSLVPAYGGAAVWMPWVRRAVTERWHPHLSSTTLIVAGVLCTFMDHRTGGGMRPGWARLITGSRVCRSTVARHLAALRQAGLLVTVAGGTHLTHHQRRACGRIADAAVYAGMVPGPPPAQDCRTPPLGLSLKLRDLTPVTRTRTPPRRRPARPGTAAAKGYDLADAFRARYPHSPVSVEVTRGWLAFELRPLAVAGWTAPDVAGWLDQRPMPPAIRRPLGWLRARLRGAADTEARSAAAARLTAQLRDDQAARREQTARQVAAAAPADAVRRAMAEISATLIARRVARAARPSADSAIPDRVTVSSGNGSGMETVLRRGHRENPSGCSAALSAFWSPPRGSVESDLGAAADPPPSPADERMPR